MLTAVSSRLLIGLIILVSVVIASHRYLIGAYDNYLIYTGSLKVLLAHQDLYAPHPELYGGLYKYSPTFPLFMLAFAWLPLLLGLTCWALLNAVSLCAAISRLWPAGDRRTVFALSLVSFELVTSLQHTQTNALVAALIIMAFVALEREQSWSAGFLVAAGFFLKGYGAAAGALSLLYPKRLRAIGATVVWFVLLAAAPLVVLTVDELVSQYRHWLGVRGSFSVIGNMSLMRVVQLYVVPTLNPVVVQAMGGLIFLLPFLRRSAWGDWGFRVRLLCSLLIALVLFNDAAEPPTYVIALAGCAIWYASETKRSRVDQWLTVSLLLAIQLISTDAYPRSLRSIAGPWTVKAVGCFAIWVRINWELLTGRYSAAQS